MSLDRILKYLIPVYGDILLDYDLMCRCPINLEGSDDEFIKSSGKALAYTALEGGFILSKYFGYVALADYILDFFK
jgi:hypothetical protein